MSNWTTPFSCGSMTPSLINGETMIFQLLIRALFIYLAYTFFKAVWRSYKTIEGFKKAAQTGAGAAHATNVNTKNSAGVYEAEFRVVSERDQ